MNAFEGVDRETLRVSICQEIRGDPMALLVELGFDAALLEPIGAKLPDYCKYCSSRSARPTNSIVAPGIAGSAWMTFSATIGGPFGWRTPAGSSYSWGRFAGSIQYRGLMVFF